MLLYHVSAQWAVNTSNMLYLYNLDVLEVESGGFSRPVSSITTLRLYVFCRDCIENKVNKSELVKGCNFLTLKDNNHYSFCYAVFAVKSWEICNFICM